MKVLIIGSTGMLGMQSVEYFSQNTESKVFCTCRKKNSVIRKLENNNKIKVFDEVDINDTKKIEEIISKVEPDLVINCAGAIKQKETGVDPVAAIKINGLFPHVLENLSQNYGFKLVLISTDCVFKGDKGNYREEDPSDCEDIYGKSKYIGEISNKKNVLTIRTSIIGLEHSSNLSLLSWFLSQKKEVNGFNKAIYSGVPTTYLAEFISKNMSLSGLYHVSSKPISKYELLKIFSDYFHHKIKINEDNTFILDRSLSSKKLCGEINFVQPEWKDLIKYFPY